MLFSVLKEKRSAEGRSLSAGVWGVPKFLINIIAAAGGDAQEAVSNNPRPLGARKKEETP